MYLKLTNLRTLALALLVAGYLLVFAGGPISASAAGLDSGRCPLALTHYYAQHGSGLLFSPPQQAVPNPFCGIYKLIKPWVGGMVLLGILLGAMGFIGRSFAPEMSGQMENGLKGVGVGLFIIGIALTPNFLSAVATALGASGLDFSCP